MERNYIAGQWLTSDDSIVNINPSDTSDVIGHYAQADIEQLNQAVQAAQEAQKIWQKTGIEKRYSILMNIGSELMQRCDELGRLLSQEEGKPLAEGKGEIYRAGQFFTYYAAEALRQIGENAASCRKNIDVEIHREPLGVVAVISPWNFPTATAAWKIAPALCFGNGVIWKPANLTPASAVALTEIISRQDIPKGLFNLVMGSGRTIGASLAAHSDIQGISFTGSVGVGKSIAAAAINNLTKIQLEMGSKNALVIMDDAHIPTAIQCAVAGAFGGTGQKCTASSRLIIHHSVYDEFVSQFVQATKALKVGHALDEQTQIGPVASQEQLEQNLQNIALAKKEGGNLLCGGEQLEREHSGFYMSPAIIDETQPDWQINQEELFSPTTNLIKVDSYDEALEVSNGTRFGLTSGIITQSLAKANHFKKNSKTGCVMVNLATAGTDYHVPFGGRGESSYGSREQGQYAKEFYTQVKTTYVNAGNIE
ncbi:MAG: aldehyde dehydrogenase family protein [Alphaproteobacteria bacterium]